MGDTHGQCPVTVDEQRLDLARLRALHGRVVRAEGRVGQHLGPETLHCTHRAVNRFGEDG